MDYLCLNVMTRGRLFTGQAQSSRSEAAADRAGDRTPGCPMFSQVDEARELHRASHKTTNPICKDTTLRA